MGEQTLQGLNIRHLLSPTISRRLGNVVFLFCRHRLAASSVCNQPWTGSTAFTGASSEKSGHLGSSSFSKPETAQQFYKSEWGKLNLKSSIISPNARSAASPKQEMINGLESHQ